MAINVRTRHMIVLMVAIISCLIVSALAFVSYFMHAVYEEEQLVDADDVPAAVRQGFAKKYPLATGVVWESEDETFEAEFVQQNGILTEAIFNPDGTFSRAVMGIEFPDLPEKARVYLLAQKNYEVIEPERIDKAGAVTEYEAKLANSLMEWDCLFDADGNLISKVRDGPVLE